MNQSLGVTAEFGNGVERRFDNFSKVVKSLCPIELRKFQYVGISDILPIMAKPFLAAPTLPIVPTAAACDATPPQ
jgi:hypothetical protein